MADYRVVDREQLDADMTGVADHIRAKAEISTPLAWPDGYKAAVDAIQTGVELPELTNPGVASDLLAGKELIGADGEVVVGNVPERGSDDLIVSNNGIVVPAGHYTKQASAVLESVELATPSIEVSDNGLITARVVQPSGYVSYGEKKQTKQLPTQGATTITPTDTPQKAVEAGTYVTGDIVVDAAEGGVEPPDSLALDPDVVYATTRPKDWLPMPTPGDDEMYLLGLIYEGVPAQFYMIPGHNGNLTIEFGTVVNGEFVAKTQFSPTSGAIFTYDIPAEDYGDLTADGCKQYMVKIKGAFQAGSRQSFAVERGRTTSNLVDAVIGAVCWPNFGASNSFSTPSSTIRYIRFTGNGRPASTQALGAACASLLVVSCEIDAPAQYYTYSFDSAYSLLAVSSTICKTLGTSSFRGCRSLHRIPTESSVIDSLANTFRESGIVEIDGNNFSAVQSYNNTFSGCYALQLAVNLNISLATNMTGIFGNCYQLKKLTFTGDNTPGGWTIDLTTAWLSHQALVEMINSLPTATATATITITGNPGAAELTDEEIAVATAKNWTIAI